MSERALHQHKFGSIYSRAGFPGAHTRVWVLGAALLTPPAASPLALELLCHPGGHWGCGWGFRSSRLASPPHFCLVASPGLAQPSRPGSRAEHTWKPGREARR